MVESKDNQYTLEGVDEDFADLLVEKEILPYLLLESLEIWWYY